MYLIRISPFKLIRDHRYVIKRGSASDEYPKEMIGTYNGGYGTVVLYRDFKNVDIVDYGESPSRGQIPKGINGEGGSFKLDPQNETNSARHPQGRSQTI